MNWVAPIKDDETLEKFKAKLREMDDKYYIMFEIGVGTGLQLQEILKFKNKDIRGKDRRRAYMDRINRSILQHIIQIGVTILCGNVKLFRAGGQK